MPDRRSFILPESIYVVMVVSHAFMAISRVWGWDRLVS